MLRAIGFICFGYLSGSLLFARYFGQLCCKRDIAAESDDKNPGVFNAFQYGGFLCGALTLCGDLLKGFLPVFLYGREMTADSQWGLALVLAAPVFGHIFPAFHHFRGGKGIAVTFDCLLGLLPAVKPVLILAAVFLFFSLVVKISPNYHRTICAYVFSAFSMIQFVAEPSISLGFVLITGLVIMKFLRSPERKKSCEVAVVWKR